MMQMSPEQLGSRLAKGLAPVYLIHGEEPLQVRDSLDAVRAHAREQGYGDRLVFDAERGFAANRDRLPSSLRSVSQSKPRPASNTSRSV